MSNLESVGNIDIGGDKKQSSPDKDYTDLAANYLKRHESSLSAEEFKILQGEIQKILERNNVALSQLEQKFDEALKKVKEICSTSLGSLIAEVDNDNNERRKILISEINSAAKGLETSNQDDILESYSQLLPLLRVAKSIGINLDKEYVTIKTGNSSYQNIPGSIDNGTSGYQNIPGSINNSTSSYQNILGNIDNSTSDYQNIPGNIVNGERKISYSDMLSFLDSTNMKLTDKYGSIPLNEGVKSFLDGKDDSCKGPESAENGKSKYEVTIDTWSACVKDNSNTKASTLSEALLDMKKQMIESGKGDIFTKMFGDKSTFAILKEINGTNGGKSLLIHPGDKLTYENGELSLTTKKGKQVIYSDNGVKALEGTLQKPSDNCNTCEKGELGNISNSDMIKQLYSK